MTPATRRGARCRRVRTRARTRAQAAPYNYYVYSVRPTTMQAGIHSGVAIRAIHYPVSVGYTIRSRFSCRNNADISTLASPAPARG